MYLEDNHMHSVSFLYAVCVRVYLICMHAYIYIYIYIYAIYIYIYIYIYFDVSYMCSHFTSLFIMPLIIFGHVYIFIEQAFVDPVHIVCGHPVAALWLPSYNITCNVYIYVCVCIYVSVQCTHIYVHEFIGDNVFY